MTVDALASTGISLEERKGVVSNFNWNIIRTRRDLLISKTDWTQVPDCPLSNEKKAEFLAYRQALRDIPQTYTNPDDVVWPTKPTL
ncbi:phage tail assembly chaperone [Enterovibrio norvegicus]|uniref:phage tail assembly chaperone n=1 Tax=Enterovibrio norvegicus TaxID=188144 RepID=UPI000C86757A